MTRRLVSVAIFSAAAWLVAAPASGQRPVGSIACIECHAGLDESRLSDPVRAFENDVHAAEGFGCLACHGGAAGRSADLGFLSKPDRRDIAQICGQCHSDAAFMRQFNPSLRVDQVTEYNSSIHGQRLREFNDTSVATCTDCHPSHGIRPPSDPESTVHPLNVAQTCSRCHSDPRRMAAYQIPTDQDTLHRSSVHGLLLYEEGDVSAPTCNDCHGNHGAVPPGVNSIRNVCGQCHATMADFFAQSGHIQIFEDAGLPGCETCHGNHAIETTSDDNLSEKSVEVCFECHEPGRPVGSEFTVMKQLIDSLKTEIERSRAILTNANNVGMEVSQAEFELEDVNNALTLARNAIHTFHVETVEENVTAGFSIASTGYDRGEAALDEHRSRRMGLGITTMIILSLIAGLALKIRQMENGTATVGRHESGTGGMDG